MVTRKSQAEIEKMRSRRPDRRRGPRARGGRARAGRLHRPPRPDRRAPHPERKGAPSFSRLPRRTALRRARPARLPGDDLHLDRRRGRPRDPRRPEIRAGQIVSVDVGAIYDGWHGDGARTFIVRRRRRRRRPRPRPGRDDPAGDDGRHRGGRRPGTASATSRPRSRTSRAPAATASSASTSATASAPRCTRSRRSRTSGPAAEGMQARAGHLPRDRADVHARRRATSRSCPTAGRSSTARRLAGRPFRAHDRGHRPTVRRS